MKKLKFVIPVRNRNTARYLQRVATPLLAVIWLGLLSASVQASMSFDLNRLESPALFSLLGENLSEGLAGNKSQTDRLAKREAIRKLFGLKASKAIRKKDVFNVSLRSDIRSSLLSLKLLQPEQIEVSVVSDDRVKVDLIWNESVLADQIGARLQVLDHALSKYIRVSQNNSAFEQLVQYMPALYNLEERTVLLMLLKVNKRPLPSLKNKKLAKFLDKHISRLANGLLFNMKALVRERRRYESDLIQSMKTEGIKFSAKPPDFDLDYALNSEGQDEEEGAWLYSGRISLLGKYGIPIVAVEMEMVETVQNEAQAEKLALAEMAKAVSQGLCAFLLKKR